MELDQLIPESLGGLTEEEIAAVARLLANCVFVTVNVPVFAIAPPLAL